MNSIRWVGIASLANCAMTDTRTRTTFLKRDRAAWHFYR